MAVFWLSVYQRTKYPAAIRIGWHVFPLLVCAYFDAVLFLELYRSVFLFLGVILYAIFASFLLPIPAWQRVPDAGAH
jgi:hypothetical protein